MNAQAVEALIEKVKALPPEQRAQVEDFVDFLSGRARRRAALDRLLASAPALEAAGAAPMSMEEINAEAKAARAGRRARSSQSAGSVCISDAPIADPSSPLRWLTVTTYPGRRWMPQAWAPGATWPALLTQLAEKTPSIRLTAQTAVPPRGAQ